MRLLSWLANEGYPFELTVGRTLSDAGWDVEHAQLYSDPITGTVREIDILASIHVGSPEHGLVKLVWVIECKTVSEPWVVFVSKQRQHSMTSGAVYFGTGPIATAVLLEGGTAPDDTTFAVADRVGHGIVRGFRDAKSANTDVAYSALLGAASAAAAFDYRTTSFWLRRSSGIAMLNVFMPLVVMSGRLFEVELGGDGKEVISEVKRSTVWSPNPRDAESRFLVNVVAAHELPTFALQSAKDGLAMAKAALQRAPEIWSKFQEGPLAQMYY